MSEQYSTSLTKVYLEDEPKPAVHPAAKRATTQISVVIVSYNSRELLAACLASIESEQCVQVVVIDNASTDGSAQWIRENFPWVTLIASDRNHGYGAAANLAIACCSSEYVLLLNCDTLLQAGTLQALSDYLDRHPKAAIVGPALVNPDGTYQDSCFPFPTPLWTIIRETSLQAINRSVHSLHSNRPLPASSRLGKAVPWVLGAALAIRRSAFEAIGGFDSSFFMYFEEVDLCYRFSQVGWQTHYAPVVGIVHVGGASTRQHRAAMTIELYKSLCHFYHQHYSAGRRFQLKLILTYLMLRNIARDAFRSIGVKRRFEKTDLSDDLLAWRSVLSNVWSRNGWLSG